MKKILICASIIFFALTGVSQAAFVDVSSDHKYKTAIDYVHAQGIVSGYSDGTYRPEFNITRGEFTKILVNAVLGDETSANCFNVPFSDVKSDPNAGEIDTFAVEICHAYQNQYISGYSDGTFRPDADITVEQASKIIAIAFKLVDPKTVEIDPNNKLGVYVGALIDKHALPSEIYTSSFPLSRGEMAEIIYRLENNITNLCGYGVEGCPIVD